MRQTPWGETCSVPPEKATEFAQIPEPAEEDDKTFVVLVGALEELTTTLDELEGLELDEITAALEELKTILDELEGLELDEITATLEELAGLELEELTTTLELEVADSVPYNTPRPTLLV